MIRLAFSFTVGFLLWLPTQGALAQIKLVKVHISTTAQDTVGSRLAYAVREGIRRSSAMQLVDQEEDGFVRVTLLTLDPDKANKPGLRTAYSVVWTTQTFHNPPVTMYLTTTIGHCGSERVSECAETIVAKTDEQVTFVRGVMQKMLERSRKHAPE